MTKDEAMKLALEALEAGEYYIDDLEAIVYAADDLGTHEDRAKMQSAITALREALAEQPAQQEPVAWFYIERGTRWVTDAWHEVQSDATAEVTPLYTTPPQRTWVGLTDEEIDLFINGKGDEDDEDYVEPTGDGFGLTDADLVQLVRKSEAKLKEKNT